MRRYIRHPSDIPIEFQVDEVAVNDKRHLNDIGYGGLSFRSQERIEPGSAVSIKISIVQPEFTAHGTVRWCHKRNRHYDIGVAFSDPDDAYRTRMVEQICHIEHYKREIKHKEGRVLTSEEAAQEWIKRYAANFPAVV